MKKCLFCGAEIQDEVIKCKSCGEFVSEKVRHAHSTGFWQDLGQRAKKELNKFETSAETRAKNRKKQSQTLKEFWHKTNQVLKKESDKFKANAPARKAQREKENRLSCLGCLGFIVLTPIAIYYLIIFVKFILAKL